MSTQPSASAVDEASRPKAPSSSGRLLLRMPPGLHAELARTAEREGASLNGYIISSLMESIGWPEPGDDPTEQQTADRPGHSTLTWLLAANVVAVTVAALAAVAILLVAWLS